MNAAYVYRKLHSIEAYLLLLSQDNDAYQCVSDVKRSFYRNNPSVTADMMRAAHAQVWEQYQQDFWVNPLAVAA